MRRPLLPSPATCEPCPAPSVPMRVESEAASNEILARLARALGHPVRVAILRRLAHMEGCYVGQIVEEFPLAQSTVSQHLKQLKDAGLIRGEIDGPRISYCIDPLVLTQFKELVSSL